MPLTDIYIARHGSRQGFHWPTSESSSVTGTKRDPPLTALGVAQAKELAQHFIDKPIHVDLIYSSPYYRCLQTASYTAEKLQLPIFVEFGISEFFQTVIPGTGLHPRPPLASSLAQYFPSISTDGHTPLLFVSRSGESVDEIHARAHTFLKLLISHIEASYPQATSVILFSHAATVITLSRALSGEPDKDVRAGTCSLTRYRRLSGAKEQKPLGEWECVMNGSTAHLAGGETRHWEFAFEEFHGQEGIGEEEKSIDSNNKAKL